MQREKPRKIKRFVEFTGITSGDRFFVRRYICNRRAKLQEVESMEDKTGGTCQVSKNYLATGRNALARTM
jgi:hypothetical protein